MDKPYLLIVNEHYYPSNGTGDWKGCYTTYEEAEEDGKKLVDEYTDFYVINLKDWANA